MTAVYGLIGKISQWTFGLKGISRAQVLQKFRSRTRLFNDKFNGILPRRGGNGVVTLNKFPLFVRIGNLHL